MGPAPVSLGLAVGGCLCLIVVIALLVWQRAHYRARLRKAKLLPPRKEEADRTCRRYIADAIAELNRYEEGHVARQQLRTARAATQMRTPLRPHGTYDPDQRRQHVSIVVRERFKRAGDRVPEHLDRFIREEVPDEE